MSPERTKPHKEIPLITRPDIRRVLDMWHQNPLQFFEEGIAEITATDPLLADYITHGIEVTGEIFGDNQNNINQFIAGAIFAWRLLKMRDPNLPAIPETLMESKPTRSDLAEIQRTNPFFHQLVRSPASYGIQGERAFGTGALGVYDVLRRAYKRPARIH